MELRTSLGKLLRRWYIIIPIFLATVALTVVMTLRQTPIYEANATYVATLSALMLDDGELASALDILSRRTEIVTTYSEIAQSRLIKNQAAGELMLSSTQRRHYSVSSRVLAGTNLVEITVRGPDPVLAKDLANRVGEKTSAYVGELYSTYDLTPLDEAAAPSQPAQPNLPLNLALGSAAGLILGLGAALLSVYLSDSSTQTTAPMSDVDYRAASIPSTGNLKVQEELAQLHKRSAEMRRQLDETRTILTTTRSETSLLLYVMRKVLVQLQGEDGQVTEEGIPDNGISRQSKKDKN